MQEIYNRRQKYLLELNTCQVQHAKLTEELNRQKAIEHGAFITANKWLNKQEEYKVTTSIWLSAPACLGVMIGATLAFTDGSVVWGCVAVACASWVAIGWKGVAKFYDWKYSAKINNLIVEYRAEESRLNELKQQTDKIEGEINVLKANIKGCDEELRMMRCLTKIKSQKKEIEAER